MAQKQEVRLVEVPPAPPKVAQKKKKKRPSLVDQAKVLLEGSPSSVAIFGEYDGGAAKAQERLASFLETVEGASLEGREEDIEDFLNSVLKSAARAVSASDLATLSKGSFEMRVQALFAEYFPEKAEASAYSAAYQVNLGKTKRWEDSDPNLVSEENPLGLKYYAVYRESTSRPGIYERVIGLRSHLPKEWESFVQKAGSRKRLTAQEEAAPEATVTIEEPQVEQAIEAHEETEVHDAPEIHDEIETDGETEADNGTQEQVVGTVEIPEAAPHVDAPSSDPA